MTAAFSLDLKENSGCTVTPHTGTAKPAVTAPPPAPYKQRETQEIAVARNLNRLTQAEYIQLAEVVRQHIAEHKQRMFWRDLLNKLSVSMGKPISKSNVETVLEALKIGVTDLVAPDSRNTPFGVMAAKQHELEDTVAKLTKQIETLEKELNELKKLITT